MTSPATIPLGSSPIEVIASWPASAPLAALTSGTDIGRHARWTIIASPTLSVSGYPQAVDQVATTIRHPTPHDHLPFTGGWIGWIAYEAGAAIEPTARHAAGARSPRDWSDACFLRCPGAFVHDALRHQWWTVGDPSTLPALEWSRRDEAHAGCVLGELTSDTGRVRYTRDAAQIIGLIHAGDAFQVNLAHHLTAPIHGDARGLHLALTRAMAPWFGAYLERPDGLGAICSYSPELFLRADLADRSVMTRPIKGTRPASCDDGELLASDKDAAELAMIVDLMRNDLGRVCEFGSVRVTDPRSAERHAHGPGGDQSIGVLHGVATVEGRLREGVGLRDLIDATFPPGSVTGAPKIRAMQIIHEFECVPRGPYCGAIGFVSDSGLVELSVAIRTASILGRRTDPNRLGDFEGEISFPVGAGLVADSDPETEWRETLDKAAAFIAAIKGAAPRRDL
jgi:anthranilate/para-aminobenzoate synthase component I